MTSRHQIDAIYGELPWLNAYAPRQYICDIAVSRINWDFLQHRPQEGSYMYPYGGNVEEIYLIDEDGNDLIRVGIEKRKVGRWNPFRFFAPHYYAAFSETVGEAFARLGEKAKDVHFAVSWWENSVTIYKPSKDLNLLANVK